MTEEVCQVFAENVRRVRRLRGWTMRRLATEAKVALSTIYRVEAGLPSRTAPRDRICTALGRTWSRMSIPHGDEIEIHLRENDIWAFDRDRRAHPHPDLPPPLNQADERQRLGALGLATGFRANLQCQLAGGNLLSGVMELYHPDPEAEIWPGEVFLYVLRGKLQLTLGDRVEVIPENCAATFLGSIPHRYEPAEGSPRPTVVLYVRSDS